MELSYPYEQVRRMAEEWYAEARYRLGDPFIVLSLSVLKPYCEDCFGMYQISEGEPILSILLPEETYPPRVRVYDRGSRSIYFWPIGRKIEYPPVRCSTCHCVVTSPTGDDVVRVLEDDFFDYFGIHEEINRGMLRSIKARSRILELYGGNCFMCHCALTLDSLTLDHIIPKSRAGDSRFINFQPLCNVCNQHKRDLPVKEVSFALDMLLRQPPSDSFEGPVW